MRTREFLSKLEHDRIVQVIRAAESKTSGEIRVLIQRGKLKSDPLECGAEKVPSAGYAQNTRAQCRADFRRAARAQIRCGWRRSDSREMRRRILATDCRDRMRTHFQMEKFSVALIEAIQEIGNVLARHFPKTSRDTNELTDDVIETSH